MTIEGLDEMNLGVTIETEDAQSNDDQDLDQGNTEESSDDSNTDEGENTQSSDTDVDTDTDTDTNTDDASNADEDVPADIDTKSLSGVEQYLAKFNIDGGMVDFKDGSKIHFDKLPAEKQLDVLSKLHGSSTQSVEDKYGLDEEEVGLINYMRQQDGNINEVINQLAQQRAETYINSQQVQTMDIDKMTGDEVYTAFLMNSNPDITAEQIETDLQAAKTMSNYDNIVKNLKSGMVKDQTAATTQQKQEANKDMVNEIEDQRKQVVDTVSAMDSIDGLTINDGIKNDVLDLILNVDDDGDSLFMTDVFSDPEKLFRAAFWYKNGTDIVASREDYWKKEKSAAYKRGIEDARTGKKTFIASDVEDKDKTTPRQRDYDEVTTLDDLYTT